MHKLWRVFLHEMKNNLGKLGFYLTLLSLPAFLGLMIGMVIVIEGMLNSPLPVGYVDPAGVLAAAQPAPLDPDEERIEMVAFADASQARQALEAEQIQAYYVFASDYLTSGAVEAVYYKAPGERVLRQFYDFIQTNLSAGLPPQVARRVVEGSQVSYYSLLTRRGFPANGPSLSQVMPLLISIIFVALFWVGSGFLMETSFKEKENRTIEVVATSMAPLHLVWGKLLSVFATSLILLCAWLAMGALGIWIGRRGGLEWLSTPAVEWQSLLPVLLVALPAYVVSMAFMFMMSQVVAQPRESEQVGPLLFLVHILPLYILMLTGSEPDHPLVVAMTFLPFTALFNLGTRWLFSSVPVWQSLLAGGLQLLYALGMVWLAGRAFRLGMLRYGQRVRLDELIGRHKPTARRGGAA